MRAIHELDGFQLFSALLALIAGPIMLILGLPTWWALLVVASGTVVLVTQCAIVASARRRHRHHGSV